MVSDGRWKLIAYSINARLFYQLFDLQKDPNELTNLMNQQDNTDEFKRLKQILNDWQKKTKDPWINNYQLGNSIRTDQIL